MRTSASQALRAGVAMALLLFLAACFRQPPAVPVSFPDDSRVLHGEWVMQLELVDWEAANHLYLADAGLMLAWNWNGESVRGWQHTAGGWSEVPATDFSGVDPSTYDPALAAFVNFAVGSGTGIVDMVAVPTGASQQTSFSLPVDVVPVLTATGSGRVFLLGQAPTSGTSLYWWDALTGEAGGSMPVPSAPDGMERSANGRILSFWDLRGGTVNVVDTAVPAAPREVRLGFCRTNGLFEASHDGRWFTVQECNGSISIVDLHATTPGRLATGLSGEGFVGFAQDSAELLHVGDAGLVRSFDPVSGQGRVLFEIPADDRHWSPMQHQLSLNRAAGRLVVQGAWGDVLLVDADSGDMVAELPKPVTGTVQLQLAASDLQGEAGFSTYAFSGTADWPAELGQAGSLTVEGEVVSYGLHDYQADLGTQAPPPPQVYITGQLVGPDAGYGFGFQTTDAHAQEYRGVLDTGGVDSVTYGALLGRP